MSQAVWSKRMQHELIILENPPAGIQAYPKNENKLDVIEAKIQGTEGTPYEGGVFTLEITIPERYPFEPPIVKFITPIYHPNIDSGGRICLDVLNSPPKGQWKPSLNINTILLSISLLMNDPNPDDPLMVEITNQYKENKSLFLATAREWTRKYATDLANVVKPVTKNDKESKEDDNSDSSDSSDGSDDSSAEDEEKKESKQRSIMTAKRKSDNSSSQSSKKIKL